MGATATVVFPFGATGQVSRIGRRWAMRRFSPATRNYPS